MGNYPQVISPFLFLFIFIFILCVICLSTFRVVFMVFLQVDKMIIEPRIPLRF